MTSYSTGTDDSLTRVLNASDFMIAAGLDQQVYHFSRLAASAREKRVQHWLAVQQSAAACLSFLAKIAPKSARKAGMPGFNSADCNSSPDPVQTWDESQKI
jgi:hypothetical protein